MPPERINHLRLTRDELQYYVHVVWLNRVINVLDNEGVVNSLMNLRLMLDLQLHGHYVFFSDHLLKLLQGVRSLQ